MVKTKSKWIGLSWPPARELIRAQVSLLTSCPLVETAYYLHMLYSLVSCIYPMPFFLVVILPGGNSCRIVHWIHAHVYRERWPGKRICWLRSCAPGRDENGRTGLSFALKMTIALYLVKETQRSKEEPHAIHFGCHVTSSRAPESTQPPKPMWNVTFTPT